MVKHWLTSE